MSGIVSDNTDVESGLVKAASTGDPTAEAGDPALDRDESVGTRYINTTSGELFICTDATAGENIWKGQLGSTVEPASSWGARGVFAAGYGAGGNQNVMDYVTISSPGNATDFGNLSSSRENQGSGLSSGTRIVWGGGAGDTMEYIIVASLGDVTDFGNLTSSRTHVTGLSNGTRGVFGGGASDDTMDYITIATTGNATDFGNMTESNNRRASTSNNTRGVFAGGSGRVDTIDYITIASLGNATDFGNLTSGKNSLSACTDGTKAVIAGGDNDATGDLDEIEYVNITSLGNATDFGNLYGGAYASSGSCGNGTVGLWGGGYRNTGAITSDVIHAVNVASTGDATDFGNLSVARYNMSGASGDAS